RPNSRRPASGICRWSRASNCGRSLWTKVNSFYSPAFAIRPTILTLQPTPIGTGTRDKCRTTTVSWSICSPNYVAGRTIVPGEMVLAALRHVWTALGPLNVPIAVMGGLSVSAWGYLRNTQDVDILIGVEKAQFDQI